MWQEEGPTDLEELGYVCPRVCPTQRVQSQDMSALVALVKLAKRSFGGLWDTT